MGSVIRILMLSSILLVSLTNCQEGILHISSGLTEKEYCIVYNRSWTPLAQSLDTATPYVLVNLVSQLLCNSSGVTPDQVKGKAVVVMRGECNYSQKALIAQELGATTLLIASNETMVTPSANESEYNKTTIPLALMRHRDILEAQEVFTGEMQVKLYSPPQATVDPSFVLLLIIAIATVALGGLWSGARERERLSIDSDDDTEASGESKDSAELFVYSPLKVLALVLVMCGMLLLMYFFYKILVYAFIVLFCLASANALFFCFDALLDFVGCGTVRFSIRKWNFSLRSIILAAVCITIAVIWAVYRNEDRWIWILQDLLGIAFCLNFMKTISLSNFKICVILLSLLLVYDVFFVFITPFFTKNGVSIMVQIALGPDASGERPQGNLVEVPAEPLPPTEKLPIMMRVPRLSTKNLCGMQFSILGYGDIIVPGLLIAYCSRFDVWVNSRCKPYFLSCTTGYVLGMILTFVVLLLSGMGQPALLYLVPFTLIASALVAWRRGEMRKFWTGTAIEVLDSSREPLLPDGRQNRALEGETC